METNNTRKTNNNINIKHTNQTILLTNITQKTPELQGKHFFHRLKAKQETRKQKHKTNKKQKQNQHRNRRAETYTMKTKTRATEEKINSQ